MTESPRDDVEFITTLLEDEVQHRILEGLAKDLDFDEILNLLLSRKKSP
jgi:hypothetical protein